LLHAPRSVLHLFRLEYSLSTSPIGVGHLPGRSNVAGILNFHNYNTAGMSCQ
jgi:hypothetical protein